MPFDASPTRVRRLVLLVSIGALILAGTAIYSAASSEITGTATYHIGIGRGHLDRVRRLELRVLPQLVADDTQLRPLVDGRLIVDGPSLAPGRSSLRT
jgi:hypothetical protein